MSRQPLFTSYAGVEYTWENAGNGEYLIHGYQDVQPFLDRNVAMANENDGYTPDHTFRRVGSIPMSLISLWQTVEGWNALDPENQDRLARKLNDIDFFKLRTAPGRLGVSNGEMR